jgi:hypothetical protein
MSDPGDSTRSGSTVAAPQGGTPSVQPPQSAQPTTAVSEDTAARENGADEGVSVRKVTSATLVCAVVAGLGHLLIYLGYVVSFYSHPPGHPELRWIPWPPCVGITLALVAALSFGGFYAASLRARVAIAASFLLTFLVLLSFELSIGELSQASSSQYAGANGAVDLIRDLRGYVGVVVGFYFGSEAAISIAKTVGVAFGNPDNSAAVMTADRDLARRPRPRPS